MELSLNVFLIILFALTLFTQEFFSSAKEQTFIGVLKKYPFAIFGELILIINVVFPHHVNGFLLGSGMVLMELGFYNRFEKNSVIPNVSLVLGFIQISFGVLLIVLSFTKISY